MKIDLTIQEVETIRRGRLTPAERLTENLARIEARKQSLYARLPAEQVTSLQKRDADIAAELARRESLTPEELRAESLVRQKAQAEAELANTVAELAKVSPAVKIAAESVMRAEGV